MPAISTPAFSSKSFSFGALLLGAALTSGCSSDAGPPQEEPSAPVSVALTESEPNDTAADAALLPFNDSGVGDLSTAPIDGDPQDSDYWAFEMVQGGIVQLQLSALRLDRLGWSIADNSPRLTIWDTDGTTPILTHDPLGYDVQGWWWGAYDLDIPMFVAPAAGTYYASVTTANPTRAGSNYSLRINPVTLTNRQAEAEAAGTTGANEGPLTAEPITPGTVLGFLSLPSAPPFEGGPNSDYDYYSFDVSVPTTVAIEAVAYRNGVYRDSPRYTDPILTLYDIGGSSHLKTAYSGHLTDPILEYTFSTPGTYFVRVSNDYDSSFGPYSLSLRTRAADSNMTELEPNDSAVNAMAVGFGEQAQGTTTKGEMDLWSFNGEAGDIIYAHFYETGYATSPEILGGGGTLYPGSEIVGTDGVTTVRSDDYGGRIRTLRAILTESGEQYLQVGYAGKPAQSGLGFAVEYKFRLDKAPAAQMEVEPNDLTTDAGALNSNGRAAGVIGVEDDVDTWSFSAEANEVVTIACYADDNDTVNGLWKYSGFGSRLKGLLVVEDANGSELASNNLGGLAQLDGGPTFSTESVVDALPSAQITFIAPEDGTYFIKVSSEYSEFGDDHKYVIERKQ